MRAETVRNMRSKMAAVHGEQFVSEVMECNPSDAPRPDAVAAAVAAAADCAISAEILRRMISELKGNDVGCPTRMALKRRARCMIELKMDTARAINSDPFVRTATRHALSPLPCCLTRSVFWGRR